MPEDKKVDARGWVEKFISTVKESDLTEEGFLSEEEKQAIYYAQERLSEKKPLRDAAALTGLRTAEAKIRHRDEMDARATKH